MERDAYFDDLRELVIGAYMAGKAGEPFDELKKAHEQWNEENKDNEHKRQIGARCFELLRKAYDAGREAAQCV